MASTNPLGERDGEAVGSAAPLRLPGVLVWLALVWLYWFEISRETLAASLGDQATARAVTFAALGGVIGRIASEAIEAGFYVTFWRSLGRGLEFPRLFIAIASFSLLDAAAVGLTQWAGDSPPSWIVPFVGFRVLPEVLAGASGLRVAFGGFGLLTLARIAGTAHAQRATGAGWGSTLGLTTALWLAGRVVTWWTVDLLRGMSPLR